jgi:hypothetical protein
VGVLRTIVTPGTAWQAEALRTAENFRAVAGSFQSVVDAATQAKEKLVSQREQVTSEMSRQQDAIHVLTTYHVYRKSLEFGRREQSVRK